MEGVGISGPESVFGRGPAGFFRVGCSACLPVPRVANDDSAEKEAKRAVNQIAADNPLVPVWADLVIPLGVVGLLVMAVGLFLLARTPQLSGRAVVAWAAAMILVPFAGAVFLFYRQTRLRSRAATPPGSRP